MNHTNVLFVGGIALSVRGGDLRVTYTYGTTLPSKNSIGIDGPSSQLKYLTSRVTIGVPETPAIVGGKQKRPAVS